MMVVVSLMDGKGAQHDIPAPVTAKRSPMVVALWLALAVVMVSLYVFFN